MSTQDQQQRKVGHPPGGVYGIHWPDVDEDLSTEGLLRGARAEGARSIETAKFKIRILAARTRLERNQQLVGAFDFVLGL